MMKSKVEILEAVSVLCKAVMETAYYFGNQQLVSESAVLYDNVRKAQEKVGLSDFFSAEETENDLKHVEEQERKERDYTEYLDGLEESKWGRTKH